MKIAQLATIPDREASLALTIESLLPQMDRIIVMLNGHKSIPKCLEHPKILKVMFHENKGDRAKFWNIENQVGYLFTCDDDLIYPIGYAQLMIDKMEYHQSIVTLHGKNYNPHNPSFFKPLQSFHCLAGFDTDMHVQVGGTGVMAWRSDMLNIRYEDFEKPNMADVYFARIAKRQGVKITAIAHQKGYLGYNNPEKTIWDESKRNGGKEQTEILKSFLK